METEKISELDVLNTAEDSDVLVINDVSAQDTMKITKQNLLKEVTNTANNNSNKIGDMTRMLHTGRSTVVDAVNEVYDGLLALAGTSEIVDSSLEATGGYIKYANGFMFQWQIKTITTSVSAWGSLYYYDTTMNDWIIPFATIFNVIPSCSNAQFWCGIGGYSTTNAGLIRVLRPNNSNYTMFLSAFGYGLWQ